MRSLFLSQPDDGIYLIWVCGAVVNELQDNGNSVEAIAWLKRQLEFSDCKKSKDAIHRCGLLRAYKSVCLV
jgi:hypothetical protein